MSHRIIIILLLQYAVAVAETIPGGQIGNMTLTEDNSPYIITKDLTVPKKKSLTIKQGTVLLFHNFTSLNVEGSLLVEGTTEKPVIFTSINDNQYNTKADTSAAPFDWNGIFIAPGSQKVKLSYFEISFTVYGLKCQSPNISVTKGKFKQNGQFHFTINGQIQMVTEGIPFDYSVNVENYQIQQTKTIFSKALPVFILTAGVLTGTGAVVDFNKRNNAHSEYLKAKDQIELDRLAKEMSTNLKKGIIYSSSTALLLPASVITYFIINKNNKDNENAPNEKQYSMLLAPHFEGHSTGLSLQINF
jgi:hypothetical protein